MDPEGIVEFLLAGLDILRRLGHLEGRRALGTCTAKAGETAERGSLHPDGIPLLVQFDNRIAVCIMFGKHPGSKLAVPYQIVATHPDAVLAAEIGDRIGPLEIPYPRLRMDFSGLHAILCGDTVELLEDKGCLKGVRYIALSHGDTDLEIVLVSILETRILRAAGTHPRCSSDERDH